MAVWGAGDQEWLAGTAGTFTMSPYVATGAHIRHVGGTSYEVTVTYDPVPPDAKPLRRPKRQPARKPTLAEALASMRPTMTGTATLPEPRARRVLWAAFWITALAAAWWHLMR
jgi:hypothetical protein